MLNEEFYKKQLFTFLTQKDESAYDEDVLTEELNKVYSSLSSTPTMCIGRLYHTEDPCCQEFCGDRLFCISKLTSYLKQESLSSIQIEAYTPYTIDFHKFYTTYECNVSEFDSIKRYVLLMNTDDSLLAPIPHLYSIYKHMQKTWKNRTFKLDDVRLAYKSEENMSELDAIIHTIKFEATLKGYYMVKS